MGCTGVISPLRVELWDPMKITGFGCNQQKVLAESGWVGGMFNIKYDPFGGFLFGDLEIYPIEECQPSALFHLRFLLDAKNDIHFHYKKKKL